ncbi:uncharacterized protein LOC141908062 isoform X2 [Tubulanus polymorphus]|uniref:uncharacterized protein LOC141908062 isoform X2 n=1 Tax=Tubulanus polymorphus TaxID=672921 RepID=UPI003DA2AC1B
MALHRRLRQILNRADDDDVIEAISRQHHFTHRKAANIYEQMRKLCMSNGDLTDIVREKLNNSGTFSSDSSSPRRSKKRHPFDQDRVSLGSTGNRSRTWTSTDDSCPEDDEDFDVENGFEVFIDYDPVSESYRDKPQERPKMSGSSKSSSRSNKPLSRMFDAPPIPQTQRAYDDTGYKSDYSTLDRLSAKASDNVTMSDIEDMCQHNAGLIETDTETITGSPEQPRRNQQEPVTTSCISPHDQPDNRVKTQSSYLTNPASNQGNRKSNGQLSPNSSRRSSSSSLLAKVHKFEQIQLGKLPACVPSSDSEYDNEFMNDPIKPARDSQPPPRQDSDLKRPKEFPFSLNLDQEPVKERPDKRIRQTDWSPKTHDDPSFRGPRASPFRDVRDIGPSPPKERAKTSSSAEKKQSWLSEEREKQYRSPGNVDKGYRHVTPPVRDTDCKSKPFIPSVPDGGHLSARSSEVVDSFIAPEVARNPLSPPTSSNWKENKSSSRHSDGGHSTGKSTVDSFVCPEVSRDPVSPPFPSDSRHARYTSKHSDGGHSTGKSTIDSYVNPDISRDPVSPPVPGNASNKRNTSKKSDGGHSTGKSTIDSFVNAEFARGPPSPPLPENLNFDSLSSRGTVNSSLVCPLEYQQPISPPLPPCPIEHYGTISSDATLEPPEAPPPPAEKPKKQRKTLSYRNRSKSDSRMQPKKSNDRKHVPGGYEQKNYEYDPRSRPRYPPQSQQFRDDQNFQHEIDEFNDVLRDLSKSMFKDKRKALEHSPHHHANFFPPFRPEVDRYRHDPRYAPPPMPPYPPYPHHYYMDDYYYRQYSPIPHHVPPHLQYHPGYYPPHPPHDWDYRDSYHRISPYGVPYPPPPRPPPPPDRNPFYEREYQHSPHYENAPAPRHYSPFEQHFPSYHSEYHSSYEELCKRNSYPGYNYFEKSHNRLSPNIPPVHYPVDPIYYDDVARPQPPPLPPRPENLSLPNSRPPYPYLGMGSPKRMGMSPDIPPPPVPPPPPGWIDRYPHHPSAFQVPTERKEAFRVSPVQENQPPKVQSWEYGQPIDETFPRHITGFDETWDESSGQPSIESTTSSFDQYVPGPHIESETDTETLLATQERESLILSPFTETRMVPRKTKAEKKEELKNRWSGSYENSTLSSTLKSNASTMTITDERGAKFRNSRYEPYQPPSTGADLPGLVLQPKQVNHQIIDKPTYLSTNEPPDWKHKDTVIASNPHLKLDLNSDPTRNSTPPPPKITDGETRRDILEEKGVIFVKPQYANGQSPSSQRKRHDIPKITIVSQSPSPQQSPRVLDTLTTTVKMRLDIPHTDSPVTQSYLDSRSLSPRSEHEEDDFDDFDEDEYEDEPVVNLDLIKAALFGEKGEQPNTKPELHIKRSGIRSPRLHESSGPPRKPLLSAGAYILDEGQDEYVMAPAKENREKHKAEIQDALTELEGLYENLALDDDNLLDGANRQEIKGNIKSSQLSGSLSRLSVENLQKFRSDSDSHKHRKLDSPSMEYTRQWLHGENERIMADAPKIDENILDTSHNSDDVFATSSTTYVKPPRQSGSYHSSSQDSSKALRRAPYPRKVADDMSRRRLRTSSVGSPAAGPHQASISWLALSPGITPATSVESMNRRMITRPRSPDPIFDDVNFRNIRRSLSTSGLDEYEEFNPLVLPSPTTADYLNPRENEPKRARMRSRPLDEADKYHDDMAYRRLRKDVEPVVSVRQRSKSLDRLPSVETKKPTPRRRGSVGKIAEMFEKQSETQSSIFVHAQSLPDLSSPSVQYDHRGDIISNEQQYAKVSAKQRTNKQYILTPRLVKQRSKYRQKNNDASEESPDSDLMKSDAALRKRLCDMDKMQHLAAPNTVKNDELSDYDNLQQSDSGSSGSAICMVAHPPMEPEVFNTRKQSKENILEYYDVHAQSFANVVAYFEESGKHAITSQMPTNSMSLRKFASHDDINIDTDDHDIHLRIRRKSGSPSSEEKDSPRTKSLRARCGSDPCLTEGRTVKPPPHRGIEKWSEIVV